MGRRSETIEGYVVDVACLRKYPRDELLQRARVHTRECALMGHCVESGYGLVQESGELALLDSEATTRVVEAVRSASRPDGIRLHVIRELDEKEMKTVRVEEIGSS